MSATANATRRHRHARSVIRPVTVAVARFSAPEIANQPTDIAACTPPAAAMKLRPLTALSIVLFSAASLTAAISQDPNPAPVGGNRDPDLDKRVFTCLTTDQTALKRRVGYYQGWAASRTCMSFQPEQIPAGSLTHINFASALIDSTFKISQMSAGDTGLWSRVVSLKNDNPGLKVYLSVGGWTFNNPRTAHVFSNLVGSLANTNTFITSAISVLYAYGFDGLDIDWNYPGAPDRGGVAADKANYVTFMTALKPALAARGYGLTFTAPINQYYLQYFDLPNLLLHADWVNLAAYDLHGYYDGIDFNFGANIRAHANLTDINTTLQTFWPQGIDPSQIVLGMAFYGRSFSLADPDCSLAGECLFVSGGDAGECSANSGTLMFSEIQNILASSGNWADLDLDAGVASIKFQDDQWVSVETAESFAMKIAFANSLCLGGSMIWSVDQDDNSYSAITALYSPAPVISTPAVPSFSQCYTTGCGATSCNPGFRASTTNYSPTDGVCPINSPAMVCCPRPYLPGECRKGGFTNQVTSCNPQCNSNEILVGKDVFGPSTSDFCISGTTGICCTVDAPFPPECTANGATWSCPYTLPYANCAWKGTPPLCDDAACPAGQISLLTDVLGDGQKPCTAGGGRVLCCDPALTDKVPLANVFPNTITSGTEAAYVELSNDIGSDASLVSSNSSYTNGNKMDHPAAFGEVFINSPKASSVSSMALASNWVIVNCDPNSDKEQKVLVYCSIPGDASCSHVHIGGAENTIVELPKSCGAGPYARIISMDVQSNHSVLPAVHLTAKPPSESVYLLHFDYDFAAVPLQNGPIYMRIDASDMPSYWDNVVASPPSRKRWIEERDAKKPLVKRWWGSFTNWVSKINTFSGDLVHTRSFNWHDTLPIYNDTRECPGPPEFQSTLDIYLTGKAQLTARYGLYIEGTIVPAEISAAYLYFASDARISVSATIEGQASVTYTSDKVTLGTYGFPGLYVPGIVSVGPTLKLTGYVGGQIAVAGSLTTGITYNFNPVSFALGKSTDQIGPAAAAPSVSKGFGYDFSYQMELDGDISIHLVPSIQLGIQLLNGKLIDAQAYVQADVSAGIGFNGSVSNIAAAQICVIPHYGVTLSGGLTGNVLYWEPASTNWPFYTNNIVIGDKCWSSVTEPLIDGLGGTPDPTARKRDLKIAHMEQSYGQLPELALHNSTQSPAYFQISPAEIMEPASISTIEPRMKKKCPIEGWLDCPRVAEEVAKARWDGDIYSDVRIDQAEYIDDHIGIAPRDLADDEFDEEFANLTRRISLPTPMVVSKICTLSIDTWPYRQTDGNYYHISNPGDLTSGEITDPGATNGNPGQSYAREHVYEMQLMTQFIDNLYNYPTLYDAGPSSTQKTAFCRFLKNYIKKSNNYPVPPNLNMKTDENLINQLRRCVPSDHNSVLDEMPKLESTQNGMKASAFSDKELRTQKTFKRYNYSKKVFVLRSVLGLAQYMDRGYVQDQFVSGSECVKAVWKTWQTAYVADNPPATNPGLDIEKIYATWIQDKAQDALDNIKNAATTMINYMQLEMAADTAVIIDPNVGIDATTIPIVVDTNRARIKSTTATTTPVSLNDLRNAILAPVNAVQFTALKVRLKGNTP